jgi:branched-chain amino acid transport system substrate-binding protein
MNKKFIGLACAAALISVPAVAAELRIGYMTTLSGGGAVLGKHQRDGFALGVEMLGGKVGGMDTKVIYVDDQRKPDVGRQLADKLVKKDRVHFIAGPIWSNVLMAIQRPITRAKVFLISTNAGASPMAGKLCSPYYFTTSWNNDMMPEATGVLVNGDGVKNTFLMAAYYQAG